MFNKIIDFKKAKFDDDGILIANSEINETGEVRINQKVKERADNYDFLRLNLQNKLDDFIRNKLADHWQYISSTSVFSNRTFYLEIGCWPSGVGEYLMTNFDSYFIGVDFNYGRLQILDESFKKKGYKKYLLILSDINSIPIKDNSVDFIYGGGVLEHSRSTAEILGELFRALKVGGISYNTIPACNLWWFIRFYNTIPDIPFVKSFFEFIHTKIFQGIVLRKHWGYQWAYTKGRLRALHLMAGFKNITIGAFAFHPSDKKLKSRVLRDLVYTIRRSSLLTAIYFVHAQK